MYNRDAKKYDLLVSTGTLFGVNNNSIKHYEVYLKNVSYYEAEAMRKKLSKQQVERSIKIRENRNDK